MDAVEVLERHHQTLRRLVHRVHAVPLGDAAGRCRVMDELADELMVHEQIEEEIFYPALRPVRDDIPVAEAEHRQLADLVALVEGMDPSSQEFLKYFEAMVSAFEHHAGAEERHMFPEVRAQLDAATLEALGARLTRRQEELRTRRAPRLKRALLRRLFHVRRWLPPRTAATHGPSPASPSR